MKVSKHYLVGGLEYMVLDGAVGQMPGSRGMALLANRRFGIGADRILVVAGRAPSFRVYDADGMLSAPLHADYVVLVSYLRERNLPWNTAEIARHLGSEAFVAIARQASFDAHITDTFWSQALQQDMPRLEIA